MSTQGSPASSFRLARRITAAAVLVLLAAGFGCNKYPESYPPPEQREPIPFAESGDPLPFLEMNHPQAEEQIVKDIRALEAGYWRWTGKEPTLRLVLDYIVDQKLVVDFSISGYVIERTGPQTVSFKVNGKVLDTVRYGKDGQYHFEKPVSQDWLVVGEDTIISMELDKVHVSDDGTELGMILMKAGFADR